LISIYTETTRDRAAQIEIARQVVSRLQQREPGSIERAAASSSQLPGVNASRYGPLRIRANEPPFTDDNQPTLSRTAVSANYFSVLGIPILAGRSFSTADEVNPEGVLIVSRSFAARWFPEGALGQVVTFVRDDRRAIVGVVEDVHAGRLTDESVPQFYVPMTESSQGMPSNYVIRTARPVDAVRADVTAFLRELDPRARVTVASAKEAMAMPLTLQRLANNLTIALSVVALLLAVVNVYALSAYAVVQRTREIGIRIALGARAADAMRLVMGRGLVWVCTGLVVGGAAALFLAAPLLERQLFETRTSDPSLLAIATLVVTAVAVLASWLPARRAARIDPAITLRAE
jgi:putative ABC transport system permease protein